MVLGLEVEGGKVGSNESFLARSSTSLGDRSPLHPAPPPFPLEPLFWLPALRLPAEAPRWRLEGQVPMRGWGEDPPENETG